jgi:CHAT domain-containing protein
MEIPYTPAMCRRALAGQMNSGEIEIMKSAVKRWLRARTALAPSLAAVCTLLFAVFADAQTGSTQAKNPLLATFEPQILAAKQKSDWAGFEKLSRQALATIESKRGPNSPEAATAATWLANALHTEGKYPEAEAMARRALAIDEKTLGPQHLDTAASLYLLGLVLESEGRYAEAEPISRRALTIREQALGAEHPTTAMSVNSLAVLMQMQGHYAEAESLARRTLAIDEKFLDPKHPNTAEAALRLAQVLRIEGRFAEAEPLARRALAIDEQALGPDHSVTAAMANNLAGLLHLEGHDAEAEPLYRRALASREKSLGPEHPDTILSVISVAGLLSDQGRYAEAEPLYRRALASDLKHLGPNHPETANDTTSLAVVLRHLHRYDEAETLYRQALAVIEKTLGPEHPDAGMTLNNLGTMLVEQRKFAEAEPLLRQALAIIEKTLGPQAPDTAVEVSNLADLLSAQGRYVEAQPLVLRAMMIAEKTLGPDHPMTANALERAADNALDQAHFADAVGALRLACAARAQVNRSRGRSAEAAQAVRARATNCAAHLSLSLSIYARQGGGSAARNQPESLKIEAFAISQQAVQSAAGDALARSAALTAAQAAHVGPQAQAYEAALLERDDLDRQFAQVAGRREAVAKTEALAQARTATAAKIDRLAAELKDKAPRYWDYRSPEPVSVAALQSASGADAVLLHEDEALILFMAVTGTAEGLVFAVSREQVAWARIGLTSDKLKQRVTRLRAEIDPEGYGLAGNAPNGTGDASGFDRQSAYELHQALLGDAAIQAVIKDKPVLLFVPSGPLTSLPPGLLVTAAPAGGREADRDAEVLRKTPWLLRSKAVALLPAVSSLRTLRQILPADHASTPDPLLVFADPNFSRPTAAPKKRLASSAARGFSAFYRDGLPLAEALDGLPSLPGTRIEGEALERALAGRPGSLLTGREASKAQLMARNTDGRLAQVKVLEFATHGLVAGDASDLFEPALALAAGARPEDELLLASEASTLKLHADWVLLSACNTASPDAPEAQGLSGLSRAFFYAGAKSLLVSHWRVRDDVAPKLIPAMLLAEQQHPELGHAQALRQATLAILDDRSIDATDPSAWAPFTLIGEAAR